MCQPVRPNPPPLSVLVRVMVLRITCIVYIKRMISLHPSSSYHFESLCLLVVASWLWDALAFSRVQPAALATQALKDIPLWPLIILFVTWPLLESSAFSIGLTSFVSSTRMSSTFSINNASDWFCPIRCECLETLFLMVHPNYMY